MKHTESLSVVFVRNVFWSIPKKRNGANPVIASWFRYIQSRLLERNLPNLGGEHSNRI